MITNEQIREDLAKIHNLIKSKSGNDACERYIKLKRNVDNSEYNIDNSVKAEFYVSFAYFLFDISEYEACINMLIKAQNYNYSKDEINEFILEAFINPNINEFKNIYERNVELLISNKCIFNYINFKDLSYRLIPINNKAEYFIYNIRDKVIGEKISCRNNININNYINLNLPVLDEFSDFLILEKWNFNNIRKYVYYIKEKNKKTYVVFSDVEKYFSCLQGMPIDINRYLSDIVIFDGFKDMKKYFQKSNIYLPRNIIDINSNGISSEAEKIIEEIHDYRIDKNWINRDNILLSICIPSYNRGKRAYENVIHNLKSYYDNEIEIVLSNNGTENKTKLYYDKIKNISDSRLSYFEFDKNRGFALNLCKVCELAKGKFILLLSDEDLVDFNVIGKILNIINRNKEKLAVLKTSINGQTQSNKLAKPGEDALLKYMLTSNYISGLIFNNNILKKYNGIEYVIRNLKNYTCALYPHMFWELLLCQYGYVCGINVVLIHEGSPEKSEFSTEKIGGSNITEIPHYVTIESRLEQHKGFLNIFKDLDICKNNFNIFRKMYIKLVNKTMYLISISIKVYYIKTDYDSLKLFNRSYEFCIRCLREIYNFKNNDYEKYYFNDLEAIKNIYNYFLKRL